MQPARRQQVGRVVQTIPFPGLSGGIAMSPGRPHGLRLRGGGLLAHRMRGRIRAPPGRQGDVIHVLRYDPKTGIATRAGVIPVPPPSGAPALQDFPPSAGTPSWPRDIAVSPNGRTFLVAAQSRRCGRPDRHDDGQRSLRQRRALPLRRRHHEGRQYGLVTSETRGDGLGDRPRLGEVIKTIQVAPPLSHPESIAVDPKAPLAFVGNANQDTITVIDTKSLSRGPDALGRAHAGASGARPPT